MTISNRASQQELQDGSDSPNGGSPDDAAGLPGGEAGLAGPDAKLPALHIDIQVHIDPASSAELIDHIFASMAKHLYGLK